MSRFSIGLRVVAVSLVFTEIAGCTARQVASPTAFLPAEQAVSSLAERERRLTSLQTPAIMDYSGPAGHLRARERLTARLPASLRVEVMSPLGVALIVAADSSEIAVFDPSDNTLMRGAANASTLARFTRIPMAPVQAVRLLLGLPPDNSILGTPRSSSTTEGNMEVLSYTRAGLGDYELGFNGGQLALVRARDAAGQVTYEVSYSGYRDIGAMNFPSVVEARFLASATTIKLHYLDPAIDGPIADSTFVLLPGPGTRLMELSVAAPPAARPGPG